MGTIVGVVVGGKGKGGKLLNVFDAQFAVQVKNQQPRGRGASIIRHGGSLAQQATCGIKGGLRSSLIRPGYGLAQDQEP
jgi:hypothetical protein